MSDANKGAPQMSDYEKHVRMAQGMEDSPQDEVDMLIAFGKRYGLDPIARQLWCQSKRDKKGVRKVQVIATIDGLRCIAEMSGEYEGQTAPQWCGPDGVWREVWTGQEAIVAARVGVYRKGFRDPIYAVARHDAYCQGYDGKPSGQWGKAPDHMTSKCAEALALRKAFPKLLSGLYTNDEMAHQEREPDASKNEPETPPKPVTTAVKQLLADCVNEAEANAWIDAAVAKGTIARKDPAEATLAITRFAEKIGAPSAAMLARAGLIKTA